MSEPTAPDGAAATPSEADTAATDPAPTEMYGVPMTASRGQTVLHPSREQYLDVVRQATDDGFTVLVDVTAVDYVQHPRRSIAAGIAAERFEVVVGLLDMAAGRRIRLRVQVPESDPTIASVFDLHPGSEALEREVFDMFGISFTDHPDLTRILMPEDWVGHPLRKDYAVGSIPVQFKEVGSR